jgi:hypothetical protein
LTRIRFSGCAFSFGTRFLIFIRNELPLAHLKKIAEKYSAGTLSRPGTGKVSFVAKQWRERQNSNQSNIRVGEFRGWKGKFD